ncbi:MAG: hypothetical protein QOE45_1274 [Frankiaceae bacterium]|jgi:hypothetical protein|nr:hypothetical protein [Frankiaceae bacterium]
MTDINQPSDPTPPTERGLGEPDLWLGEVGGDEVDAGPWQGEPGGGRWGRDRWGGGAGEGGPWPVLAGLIVLAVFVHVGAIWHDIGGEFGPSDGRLTFVLQAFAGYGQVALLAQVACASVARGTARAATAIICLGTATLITVTSVVGLVVGETRVGLGGSGSWSTRAGFLTAGVLAVSIGLVAQRLMRER